MRECEFIACIQIAHKTQCTHTWWGKKLDEYENHKEYIKILVRCRENARFLYTTLFASQFHSGCHMPLLACSCSLSTTQHFFIHNAHDTYVFIGHTSIRNDKNDNDLHQLRMCVMCVDGLQSKDSSIIYVWNGKQAGSNSILATQ